MFALEEKVIFVTGGNRGIGAAIVELLHQNGATVAYTYRSEPGPEAALALKADVTDPASMETAVAVVEEKLGPIYGAVLNAGITKDNLFPNISVEDWYAVIDTNLNGVYNTLRPIVPKLYERGNGALVPPRPGVHTPQGRGGCACPKPSRDLKTLSARTLGSPQLPHFSPSRQTKMRTADSSVQCVDSPWVCG